MEGLANEKKDQIRRNAKQNTGRESGINCLREPLYHPVLGKKRKPSNSQL
jgi:hypothetical protein